MNDPKKIHNIVASTVLADAVRYVRYQFLTSIKGSQYKATKDDDILMMKMEHEMRKAMERVLLQKDEGPGQEIVTMAKEMLIEHINIVVPAQYVQHQVTLKGCSHTNFVKETSYTEHFKRIYRHKDFPLPVVEYTDHLQPKATISRATLHTDPLDSFTLDELAQIATAIDRHSYKVEPIELEKPQTDKK